MALSGIVINRITRVGDIGEPGYSAYGEKLKSCTYSGSQDDWHGATQGDLRGLLPSCYITESVYAYLTDAERENARPRIVGIIPNSYVKTWTYTDCTFRCKTVYCRGFKDGLISRPMPAANPCVGVVCKPECVGVDLYETVCKEGACVRGALMEANSVECGYVKPECTEGDKKPGNICRGGKWVPYTPEMGRLYVKFAIPWLDLLPGIPYEPWMIIPPGFKVVEEP